MNDKELCEGCAQAKYGTAVPMPGVLCMDGNGDGMIEKCDECKIYDSDEAAAYALTQEMAKRGDYGRVQVVVMAYEFHKVST